ncbi:MAG: glycosyltransferase family 9 protein [Acidobacteriota bacterium]|nr:glycosyltransferase family 9 protein [Blastocatellia bacterium]MDW8412116.1 glycosyltransferase family 9 protein [Acidobacteriota bacterium]
MNFLVVRLSAIGDCVHALPAVAALKETFPDSRIGWVVEKTAAKILEGSPVIDELIVVDTKLWRRSPFLAWREAMTAVARCRKGFDVALDMQGLLKSGLFAALSTAKVRLGFSNNGLREEASRFFLTHQVVVDSRLHVIEKNLQLVRAIGAKTSGYKFPIYVSEADEGYIDELLGKLAVGRFAIINPGGGWVTKLWPAERFGLLADALAEHFGLYSLVTLGPGEEQLADRVVSSSRRSVATAVNVNLKQFVALAKRAVLFVGSDTGPLHIAAAVATPIVGIYGPTDPSRNGPINPLDVCVELNVECRQGCYRRHCPTIECMDISVDQVLRGVERRLQQTKLWQLKR